MKNDIDALPNDPELLKKLLLEMSVKCAHFEEMFRVAQNKQFGKSSEVCPDQGDFFNEAEHVSDEELNSDLEQEEPEAASPQRKKPTRSKLPMDTLRETIIYDISDDEKQCDCCGHELHKMGEDKSEKLEFVPAQIKVVEHVRPKYSCRNCEKTSIKVVIKQAPLPPSIIPKSFATPSLLSQIITSKYQYALPLYRQESMFKQYGIALSRQTMSSWALKCAEILKPLYQHLHQVLLQQRVIHADETTVNVLASEKSKCYMWLYCTGSDSPANSAQATSNPKIVLYDYHASRASTCAIEFLQGYSGYLQVDGYQGYASTKATLVGCWAHARRKFIEADVAQGKGKSGKANFAVNFIKKLYRIEIKIKELSPEEKYDYRQEHAKPLLNEFHVWLIKSSEQVLPKTALGKALSYNLNQWPKLIRYLEDGELNIDNNRAERAIKPFVIGRKNWMFSNAAKGAEASAVLYSLIETAKSNGLVPFDYLHHILKELGEGKPNAEDLLPWNVSL